MHEIGRNSVTRNITFYDSLHKISVKSINLSRNNNKFVPMTHQNGMQSQKYLLNKDLAPLRISSGKKSNIDSEMIKNNKFDKFAIQKFSTRNSVECPFSTMCTSPNLPISSQQGQKFCTKTPIIKTVKNVDTLRHKGK